jgi:MFS family permease
MVSCIGGGRRIATSANKVNLYFSQTFASLRYPNYRLWFVGQLVSLAGTWMQSTAQGYLMYELTKSSAMLGYVGFVGGLPSWFFTLYGGVVADRIPRRKLMIITQTSMMILAFILGVLTFTKLVQPWHILVLAFLLGIANAFDAPARQSFTLEMVERQDLTNAIALNSAMFTSAMVIGPALGGLAYAAIGPGWCFMLNGISFIAVIVALALMKLKPLPLRTTKTTSWIDLKEGLKYVIGHRVIRMLILNLGVISLLGLGVITLLPAWSVDVLGGDAKTNGLLLSARGLGSLISALIIASLGRFNFRGKLLTYGSLGLPIMMILFSFIHWLPLSLVVMVGMGLGFMLAANTTNALVQTQVQDELRGRVMGVYTLIFFGAMPVGSLLAGTLASRLGEPVTILLSAVLLLVFTLLVLLFFPALRRLE